MKKLIDSIEEMYKDKKLLESIEKHCKDKRPGRRSTKYNNTVVIIRQSQTIKTYPKCYLWYSYFITFG